MIGLTMVGITHHGASLAFLERVAVRKADCPARLDALRAAGCSEAVLLSTCSRVEIYLGTVTPAPNELLDVILDILAHSSGASREELRAVVEVRAGQAVIEHLFRLTAGLESRVLGEVEILTQARSAFREARAAGMTGLALSLLFPAALRSGRRVRADTSLGACARSLAHQAVDFGLDSLGGRTEPVVLVVGSGQMACAAVDHLAGLGIHPSVAARDEQYAARLAGTGGVCPLPALTQGIAEADLLICATSAAHHVVTASAVSNAMSGRARPLTVVDLSMPRNVDAAVGQVPQVTLIDIDGLTDVGSAEEGLATALSSGAAMASAAAQAFTEELAGRDAGPVIAALRRRVERTCHDELVRAGGLGACDPEALARSAHSIAGKLLHRPTVAARQAAAAGDSDALRYLCELFGIPLVDVGQVDLDMERPGRGAQMAG